MKNLYFLLILLFLISITLQNAEWYFIHPDKTVIGDEFLYHYIQGISVNGNNVELLTRV
jgi:hypothetical protein